MREERIVSIGAKLLLVISDAQTIRFDLVNWDGDSGQRRVCASRGCVQAEGVSEQRLCAGRGCERAEDVCRQRV